jgi:hypothetical protein
MLGVAIRIEISDHMTLLIVVSRDPSFPPSLDLFNTDVIAYMYYIGPPPHDCTSTLPPALALLPALHARASRRCHAFLSALYRVVLGTAGRPRAHPGMLFPFGGLPYRQPLKREEHKRCGRPI